MSGKGSVSVYLAGQYFIMQVGDGSINLNNKSTNNLQVSFWTKEVLKFDNIDDELINVLTEIMVGVFL